MRNSRRSIAREGEGRGEGGFDYQLNQLFVPSNNSIAIPFYNRAFIAASTRIGIFYYGIMHSNFATQ